MYGTNDRGGRRGGRASVWVLLALACGKADEADVGARPSDSTESAGVGAAGTAGNANAGASSDVDAGGPGGGGAANATDAGESPEPGDDACPNLRRENCTGAANTLWARVPPTSKCCPYYNSCEFPLAWSAFPSQQECESNCRCRDVRGDIDLLDTLGGAAIPTERTTFDCWCADNDCSMISRTLSETAAYACAVTDEPASLSQLVGCGMVAVRFFGGFVGGDDVFDTASGNLIGKSNFTDSPRSPCRTYHTIIGTEFDCPEAVECALCDGPEPMLGCE